MHTKKRVLIASGMVLLVGAALPPASAYERPGKVEVVSVSSSGEIGNNDSNGCGGGIIHPAISPSARFVAFESAADNLVRGDTNLLQDTFVHDRAKGKTTRVSVSSSGSQQRGLPDVPLPGAWCRPDQGSQKAAISATGRYVAFTSSGIGLTDDVDLNKTGDVFVHDRRTSKTELISVASEGVAKISTTADGESGGHGLSISANGRYVVFDSVAGNLLKDPPPECRTLLDLPLVLPLGGTWCPRRYIYVRDRKTNVTRLVSVSSTGEPANAESTHSSISAGGRHVAFHSRANNLDERDRGLPIDDDPAFCTGVVTLKACSDVFVRNLRTGKTRLVSLSIEGAPGNANSDFIFTSSVVSSNGRYVAFQSQATDLVPNPDEFQLGRWGFYVHDGKTGRTTKVNVTSVGGKDVVVDHGITISGNGRYVTWVGRPPTEDCTGACGFVDGWGLYVHDLKTGSTEPVWLPESPWTGRNYHALSGSGRHVAFGTPMAVGIQKADNNTPPHDPLRGAYDVFVYDRGETLGVGGLLGKGTLSVRGGGTFSSSGIFAKHDALGDVDAALTKQGANLIEGRVVYRPRHKDLFVVLELQDMPSLAGKLAGNPAVLYGFRLNVGTKSYEIRATAMDGGTFVLFDCNAQGSCGEARRLAGGYGTTGKRVVFSLPLSAIGMQRGGELSGMEGFTALGSEITGALEVIDRIRLK